MVTLATPVHDAGRAGRNRKTDGGYCNAANILFP